MPTLHLLTTWQETVRMQQHVGCTLVCVLLDCGVHHRHMLAWQMHFVSNLSALLHLGRTSHTAELNVEAQSEQNFFELLCHGRAQNAHCSCTQMMVELMQHLRS